MVLRYPFLQEKVHHARFPLFRCGWVYEERLLSPRVILFTREELIWECSEGTACECVTSEENDWDCRPGLPEDNDREDIMKTWHQIVESYTNLDLTFSCDALPALSGIAHVFPKLLDDEYQAGLWKENIVADLLWYMIEVGGYLEHSRWRAPSWSWVTTEFEGRVVFLEIDTSLVEVIEEVDSGFLRLGSKASNASIEFRPETNETNTLTHRLMVHVNGMTITGLSDDTSRKEWVVELTSRSHHSEPNSPDHCPSNREVH
jgi:hypothetical protein